VAFWVYRQRVSGARQRRNSDTPQTNADEEVGRMQAAVGDRLHVHGNIVGHPDRTGEIVEVRGAGGEPPYLVRFDDGHTSLVFPGPDAIIEHPHTKGTKGTKGSAKG
jgi:Domain of unknown function (DUF1918)